MSGRYKPYPEYRDSGIELLGEFPKHWKATKFRYLFSLDKGLTITKADLKDEGIPCVNYGEVHSKYGFRVDPEIHPLKCVGKEYLNSSSSALLGRGDLVFADTSEDLEGAGNFTQSVGGKPIFAGYHTIIARADRSNSTDFLSYAIDSEVFRTQIQLAVKGVKVFSITQAILRCANLWLPPNAEQIQIARFLDYETAKIDLLIEKQLSLIDLLKEKRQAVISHAVTKGLNPDVPMRDSGVEWLGDVPEHWNVLPLKFCALVIDCKHITAEFIDSGYPLASIGEVKGGYVDLNAARHTSHRFYIELIEGGREPRCGDIIYSRNATVGEASLVPDQHPKFAMGQDVCLIRSGKNLAPQFAFQVLNSRIIFHQLETLMIGSTFKRINVDQIRNFTFVIPPYSEQLFISSELTRLTSKFDNLIQRALETAQILKERRAALISAAVTGKIDVRDWKAPESDPAKIQ